MEIKFVNGMFMKTITASPKIGDIVMIPARKTEVVNYLNEKLAQKGQEVVWRSPWGGNGDHWLVKTQPEDFPELGYRFYDEVDLYKHLRWAFA